MSLQYHWTWCDPRSQCWDSDSSCDVYFKHLPDYFLFETMIQSSYLFITDDSIDILYIAITDIAIPYIDTPYVAIPYIDIPYIDIPYIDILLDLTWINVVLFTVKRKDL